MSGERQVGRPAELARSGYASQPWGGVALTAPTILGLVARTTFAGSASRRCATPPVDRRHSEQADRDGHHAGDTSRVAG